MSNTVPATFSPGPSHSGLVGTVGYTIYNTNSVISAARTTSGITELIAGSGIYVAAVPIPDSGGDVILWDTGVGLNQSAYALFPSESYTPSQVAAAVLAALATPYTNLVTGSLGTSITITSNYSAFQSPYNFIIQAGSQLPVLTALCTYQGTTIAPSSATLRVWTNGDPRDYLNVPMSVNNDNSVTYNFLATDLLVPGKYNFEILVTDSVTSKVIPCPYISPALMLVTPNV